MTKAMASASVSLHYLGRGRPALGLVQHLVREFMDKGAELLGLGLSGKNGNPSAVADAKRGGDLLGKDKLDALGFDERNETVAVLANRAAHLPHGGKLCAFGLRHIEDVGIAESNKNAGVLLGDVLFGFLVLLALDADDGSENANPFLAFLHLAAKLVPCVQSSNAGCGRPLPRNLQNVSKAVVVESAHRVEVGGECVGVSGL